MKLQLSAPSFGYGTSNAVNVGGVPFAIPAGARAVKVRGGRLAYVDDPVSGVHAFVAAGEVEVPSNVQKLVRERFFT